MELTFILGPPADAQQRAFFDRMQAAIRSGPAAEAATYEREQAACFAELFRRERDEPSIVEDLLAAILGATVRLRDHELTIGLARGFWVPCLTFALPDSAVQDDGRNAIAAALGKMLQRDWVMSFVH
jgi:hypothetical protein